MHTDTEISRMYEYMYVYACIFMHTHIHSVYIIHTCIHIHTISM